MSSLFELKEVGINGLSVLQRKPLGDSRGYLERIFCQQDLQPLLKGKTIAQINHTLTKKKGTVRGMHFQYPPHAEVKFVSCLKGEVFDVVVDLRNGSPTFLQYYTEILSAENHKTLVVPEGFAHGFQSLTKDCEMLYLHTAEYNANSESAINAIDLRLNIQWPIPIVEISDRDRNHSMITDRFEGIIT